MAVGTITWVVAGPRALVCRVFRLKDEVQCYAGRVDPGPGTYSPYRSEAYRLLVGSRVAWAFQITRNIQLTLDNQSIASVFQRGELSCFRLVSSQDRWDETG